MPKKLPPQKPGKSKQDYGTPNEFLDALEEEFEIRLVVDLACRPDNKIERAVTGLFEKDDSLVQNWGEKIIEARNKLEIVEHERAAGWLNPPFGKTAAFSEKCSHEAVENGARSVMLIPAAIGTKYFREHIAGKALVVGISRMTFVGKSDPYIKDLMICFFGWPETSELAPGFGVWDWKKPGTFQRIES